MMMMMMMMMHRLRLSSTNFTGSILEYFVPYVDSIPKSFVYKDLGMESTYGNKWLKIFSKWQQRESNPQPISS